MLVLSAGACAKKRISECDALAAKIEKIAACPEVPDDQRATILESAKTIRASMQMIEDAGGVAKAPEDLVSSMRDTCKTQGASLDKMYADCLH